MKFILRTRKSRRKVIWKMNRKHSTGVVLCFPTGKKKHTAEFPYPSPQYSKRSPKRTQNSVLLLLYWCQPLQDKKDEGVRAQPASPLPAVPPSISLHTA